MARKKTEGGGGGGGGGGATLYHTMACKVLNTTVGKTVITN